MNTRDWTKITGVFPTYQLFYADNLPAYRVTVRKKANGWGYIIEHTSGDKLWTSKTENHTLSTVKKLAVARLKNLTKH